MNVAEDNVMFIKTKIEPNIDEIKSELDNVLDNETMEEVEKLYRELSILSVNDLLRPFTI